jgi:hypothetical protein
MIFLAQMLQNFSRRAKDWQLNVVSSLLTLVNLYLGMMVGSAQEINA